MTDEGTQNANEGTPAQTEDAELEQLRADAEWARQNRDKLTQLETQAQKDQELADQLGYDSVEEMREDQNRLMLQEDEAKLNQLFGEEKKTETQPKTPVQQPKPAEPPKQVADPIAVFNFVDNQWIKYAMKQPDEVRQELDENAMRKVFYDNRAVVIAQVQKTGKNIFEVVDLITKLKTSPQELVKKGEENAEAKRSAKETASTTTGRPVVDDENKTDDEKRKEEMAKVANVIAPDDEYVYGGG